MRQGMEDLSNAATGRRQQQEQQQQGDQEEEEKSKIKKFRIKRSYTKQRAGGSAAAVEKEKKN